MDTMCSVSKALDVIGGKWKSVALYYLLKGPLRFNQLRRLMPSVTQRMLTLQLRELERDGLLRRTVYPVVPPHVEYALTEKGRTLEPLLIMLRDWGWRHAGPIIRQRISGICAEFSAAKQAAGARVAAVKRIANDMSFAVEQFWFIRISTPQRAPATQIPVHSM